MNIKRYHHLLLLLLLFTICSSCALFKSNSKSPENLKVMTYNIWNGFDWGKDTTRRDKMVAWIKEKNPDVLALQELCGFNKEKLKREAKKWGHPYVEILKTSGYPVGLTSKKPIVLKDRVLKGLWHGMLHCETFGIDFFVVHLSPSDCDFRGKESRLIKAKIKTSGSDHYLILGDFNAHSPDDKEIMDKNDLLLKRYARTKPGQKYFNLKNGAFDYSVISSFYALPAIDVCNQLIEIQDRFTCPTPALIGTYLKEGEDKIYKERIDYILASPKLAESCVKATIYNGEETGYLSDHYPVMVELDL